jgi:hypothetical protein
MATGRTYLHWQPSRGGYTQATPQTQTKTTALPSERIKQILVRECGVPPRMIRDKGVAGVDVDLEGLPEARCQPGGPGYHEAKKSFQSRSSSLSTTQRSSGRSRQSPRV